jgi:AmmeMemoRadiSam system protein A
MAGLVAVEHGATLLALARGSVEHGVREGRPLRVDASAYAEALREPGASFVTLEREGALRGCIGSLDPRRALVVDVVENAYAAAFRDPRFPPLSADELAAVAVHLAILSPLERIGVASEEELLARLRPGVHGVLLQEGAHRGTFLPAVWAGLSDPREFVRQLKRKAGLAPDHWSESLEVWIYTAVEIR